MTRRRIIIVWSLAVFWLLITCGYVASAWRQKERLNLSATAGGQMPYLVYAQRIATEGWFDHFGDRNRMPLVPAVVSLVYRSDWAEFINRASWMGISLSLALLAMMGIIAYVELSPLFATAYLLIVAVTVFAPQSSFVQADVPYYAMFFCSWWAMARLLQCPKLSLALLAGLALALAYLTKASILPAIPIWLGMMALRAIFGRKQTATASEEQVRSPRSLRFAMAAGVTLAVFLAIISPYLANNQRHFDRYFYNVNTTFFVWCDSWSQAQRFSETYAIDQHYPDAPADSIPGPMNYWRTHTVRQIAQRLWYGVQTLGRLMLESQALKYLLFLTGCALVTLTKPALAFGVIRDGKWLILFSALLLSAYVLAYSWYVVVAYGDRFVLSLVPPALFGLCVYLDRVASTLSAPRSLLFRLSVSGQLALVIITVTLADGVAAANTSWITPSENFVRFYYDESHEELRRGNLPEAERGMRGVVALDPAFAAAHRDLGMIALAQHKPEAAIEPLSRAAKLEPTWADVQNSLGSALVQAGRLSEAVSVLEQATMLDPTLTPAWYNLCGTFYRLGRNEQAESCLWELERISPDLAQRLRSTLAAPIPGISP